MKKSDQHGTGVANSPLFGFVLTTSPHRLSSPDHHGPSSGAPAPVATRKWVNKGEKKEEKARRNKYDVRFRQKRNEHADRQIEQFVLALGQNPL